MRSVLNMLPLILSAFAVMLASLSGKLLVWRSAGSFIERNLHLMVSFAAGVFLLFAFQLGQEVFDSMTVASGLLWIVGGAIGITILCRLMPHGHSGVLDHDEHGGHDHGHAHLDAHRLFVSDSIHNVGDGIFLAASFAISPITGMAAAAGVVLHEVVQEISEFFVYRDAGYSVRKALMLNFITSSTVLIGAIGGYMLLETFESIEAPLLAVAAGGVLSVIFSDLLPHSFAHARGENTRARHLAWFFIGAAIMFGVMALVPHEHEHDSAERAVVVAYQMPSARGSLSA